MSSTETWTSWPTSSLTFHLRLKVLPTGSQGGKTTSHGEYIVNILDYIFGSCQETSYMLSPQEEKLRGTWVVPSAKCLTLELGSGHDPKVVGWSPESRSVLSVAPA